MQLVASIDSVVAQMFPKKQIHAEPEGCPTIAELLPLKWKEQTIAAEMRKQKDQSQNNQLPNKLAAATKSPKTSSAIINYGQPLGVHTWCIKCHPAKH